MSEVHWYCASYAMLALATFFWLGVLTRGDEYDAVTWVARIICSVLWPAYWFGATCVFVADRHLLGIGKGKKEEDGRHD